MATEMDALAAKLGVCISEGLCGYHQLKIGNRRLQLEPIASESLDAEITVPQSPSLLQVIEAMPNVAGSWELMGEQREWYTRAVSGIAAQRSEISIAIFGVAGPAHYRGTVELIQDAVGERPLRVYTIDRCIGPLAAIGGGMGKSDTFEYAFAEGQITHYGIVGDLTQPIALPEGGTDIVSAHFTLSMMQDAEQAGRIIGQARRLLRPDGRLLAGQGRKEYMGPHSVPDFFGRNGMRVVDFAKAWDVYDMTPAQKAIVRDGGEVRMPNDNYLLDMCRA
jgi:SAM-dependent methyltransferase